MADNAEYAKLLSSVKIANTGFKRVLSPIQVAHQIQRLINEEGLHTTCDILPLTRKSITAFTRLLKLDEKYHDAIVWGESGDLGVGFSAASCISVLRDKDDQGILFSATSRYGISKKDVLSILSSCKKNADVPLQEIIKRTIRARPVIINNYLVVISISHTAQVKIKQNSQMLQVLPTELLKKGLKDKLGITNMLDVQIKDKNVGIVLDKSDYKRYKRQISLLRLEYDGITDYILQNHTS